MQPDVSRETGARLALFEQLVRDENKRHNLVAASTLDEFQSRHIADALQLTELAPPGKSWCDIGSGAGLPGMVIAIATQSPVTLIEPRRLRADFLTRAAHELGLSQVSVIQSKAQNARGSFDVLTARAVASLDSLFDMAGHLAHRGTRWILPKGRTAKKELEEAAMSWQGRFAMHPSTTSADAMVVVAEQVARRGRH